MIMLNHYFADILALYFYLGIHHLIFGCHMQNIIRLLDKLLFSLISLSYVHLTIPKFFNTLNLFLYLLLQPP